MSSDDVQGNQSRRNSEFCVVVAMLLVLVAH